MTDQDCDRNEANVEAGLRCPTCGSVDVETTGVFDAGFMRELWGCNDCGEIDTVDQFQKKEAE